MIRLLTIFSCLVIFATCRKPEGKFTQICVDVKHHEAFMPNTTVYMKYNDTVFPGYKLDELDIFDASFQVDENGYGCFKNLPLGNHWLVAHGIDEDWGPDGAPIRGSIRISLDINRFQIDSTIYVQEY
ncbi:MAG: hypothetical protein AAF573_18770 [Bacteroidota bacterium]